MRASWLLVVTFALGSSACLRGTEYRCSTNTECGTGGTCESIGFCSFPDTTCMSGERFGESAGDLANQCTGMVGIDAGPTDGPGIDVPMIDSPPTGCPGNYVTITGGQGTHRYRTIPAANWNQQRDMCLATTSSAYLAIPDDLGELQAIATLAAQGRFWVGITDQATENTWLNTKGVAQTFLPWIAGAPDDGGPGEDCVEGIMATSQINDERCNTQYVAVCECEP
jgi:hypothetical protein